MYSGGSFHRAVGPCVVLPCSIDALWCPFPHTGRTRVSRTNIYLPAWLCLLRGPRRIIAKRLVRDRPTTAPVDNFSVVQLVHAFKSPHVLLVFVALFMNGTTLFGLALFLPTIVNQLGFSPTKTQLISVGPFATGFFGMSYFLSNLQSYLIWNSYDLERVFLWPFPESGCVRSGERGDSYGRVCDVLGWVFRREEIGVFIWARI